VVHTVADLIRATLVAIGSSGLVALALGGVVIVGVAVACRNRSLDGRWLAPLAMAAGALQFLAATAYGRAATGPNPVKQGRYLDIAACLLLPLISHAGETIARLDRRAAVGVFAVFALGIPANVRAAGPSDGAPADRAAFVALAESPLLGQVDPEHRPDLERFPSVTTGWLIAAVRRSGLPPGPAPDASTRASADLLLSLQQLALQHPVPPCEPLTGPVTLSLREHDLVSYMAAGIDVSAATPDGAGTVTYHPTAGAIGGTLRAALPILDVTIRPSFKVPGVLCIRPSSRRD
jgi:hypothetical protein